MEEAPPAEAVAVRRALELLRLNDPVLRVQAAKDIRRLTKTSHRCRRQLRQAVTPLVSMLRVDSPEFHEPALLALLNLAVQDEKYVPPYLFLSKISNQPVFFSDWVFRTRKKLFFLLKICIYMYTCICYVIWV